MNNLFSISAGRGVGDDTIAIDINWAMTASENDIELELERDREYLNEQILKAFKLPTGKTKRDRIKRMQSVV